MLETHFLQFLILILMMNHLCILKTVEPMLSEGVAHCAMVWPVTRAVRVWRQSVWWDYHHQQPAATITSAADQSDQPHTFTIKLLAFITLEQGQSQSSSTLYIFVLDIGNCNFQTLRQVGVSCVSMSEAPNQFIEVDLDNGRVKAWWCVGDTKVTRLRRGINIGAGYWTLWHCAGPRHIDMVVDNVDINVVYFF